MKQHSITTLILSGLLVMVAMTTPLSAQNQVSTGSQPAVGIFGAFQLVQHELGTSIGVAGIPTCGRPDDGNGSGIVLGGLYQMPLISRLSLQLRASFSNMGGRLSSTEIIGNAVSNGEVVDAVVEHSLEPSISIISFEPMLQWQPFDFPLAINLGIQAGTVTGRTADQAETLIEPNTATFTNGTAVRNSGNGELPVDAFYGAGFAGLGYDIPIGTSLVLAPEVAYHLNLSNALEGTPWRGDALRLGVSLRMLLNSPPSPKTEEPMPSLAATVQASGLYRDSSEQPMVQVQIEEFLGTQLRPLLNYVFFEDDSSLLPERYKQLTPEEARSFSVEKLHYLDALETYHRMLDIIGRRMQENPHATLRLVGCNAEAGAEKGNAGLAEARAETVRDYLVKTWKVADDRITVETRGLPSKPSNVKELAGIAENRRVEIYTNEPRVLEPVLTNDTIRTANPPGIRFRSTAQAEAGMASWRLTASQSGQRLKEFSGSGDVPTMLDWNLEQDQENVPRFPIPIDYQLEVTDVTGQTRSVEAQIPTDQITLQRKRRERVADKEVNRYSLILFAFGTAELDAENRKIVDFIKSRITLNSTVSVTGYTDLLGDKEFNQKLSEDRANVTAKALGVGKPIGAGEAPLFDNLIPEGRFYCRTVNVVVETPIVE